MCVQNFMVVHPIVVETFHSQMYQVLRVHPLGTINVEHFVQGQQGKTEIFHP